MVPVKIKFIKMSAFKFDPTEREEITALFNGNHTARLVMEKIESIISDREAWISVEAKLPNKGQKVLCIQNPKTTATREPLFAFFDGKDFIPPAPTYLAYFEIAKSKWVDIILWQPLPNPPKDNKK